MGITPEHPIETRSSDVWFSLKGKYMRALEQHVLEPFRADILEIQGRIREELNGLPDSEDAPLLRKALEHRLALTQRALLKVEDDFATMAMRRLNDVAEEELELVDVRR